jgi:hypothetical protein
MEEYTGVKKSAGQAREAIVNSSARLTGGCFDMIEAVFG